MNKFPIKYISFGGYRRFCKRWWMDLFWYVRIGWIKDIYCFWHRGRYGWSPQDVWSLYSYMEGVFAGALHGMATSTHGVPGTYPDVKLTFDPETNNPDFERWVADLKKWSDTFAAAAREDYHELHGKDYKACNEDEEKRAAAVQQAFSEMLPWWRALWT